MSRLAPARRRSLLARAALLGGGATLFVATMGLARLQFPGHRKAGVTPLSPPVQLLEVVKQNRLAAGILGPAEASPQIASAPS